MPGGFDHLGPSHCPSQVIGTSVLVKGIFCKILQRCKRFPFFWGTLICMLYIVEYYSIVWEPYVILPDLVSNMFGNYPPYYRRL